MRVSTSDGVSVSVSDLVKPSVVDTTSDGVNVSVSDLVRTAVVDTTSDGVNVSVSDLVLTAAVDTTSDGVSVSVSVTGMGPLLMLKAITDHFEPSPIHSTISVLASLRSSAELRKKFGLEPVSLIKPVMLPAAEDLANRIMAHLESKQAG